MRVFLATQVRPGRGLFAGSNVRILLLTVTVMAAVYGLLTLLLYLFQSRLVYYPDVGRGIVATPDSIGLVYEELWIAGADGATMHAWFVPAPDLVNARGIVLYLHGNAGNMSHRLDALDIFNAAGLSTLIFDYRGYGQSAGQPSEQNTYEDAEAAWRYLVEQRGFAPERIVVFGESLGGAVAAWLAARTQPRPGALMLGSAFTSMPALAGELYPVFPSKLLARFDYNTLASLDAVTSPVLIAHSPEDRITPFAHGQRLFERASEPRQFLELAGSHGDIFSMNRERWLKTLTVFLDQHLQSPTPSPEPRQP